MTTDTAVVIMNRENELLPAQLNLVETVVGDVLSHVSHGLFLAAADQIDQLQWRGKTMVEFFSDAISVSVCR